MVHERRGVLMCDQIFYQKYYIVAIMLIHPDVSALRRMRKAKIIYVPLPTPLISHFRFYLSKHKKKLYDC